MICVNELIKVPASPKKKPRNRGFESRGVRFQEHLGSHYREARTDREVTNCRAPMIEGVTSCRAAFGHFPPPCALVKIAASEATHARTHLHGGASIRERSHSARSMPHEVAMPASDNPESVLNRLRSGLGRHLVLVLVLKVLVLTALWHAFIKPYRVKVDQEVMSARLAGPSIQTNKGNSHDRSNGR